MKWEHALIELKAGTKVQRAGWYKSGKRISLPMVSTAPTENDILSFRRNEGDGSFEPWNPSEEDIAANDWQTC